jgi:serine/threonine protein kinase
MCAERTRLFVCVCVWFVSQVAKGDLEAMLHDPNIYLSLTLRMKMARDAALGMNWLHLSQPKFIHRDLKTSNLLVDENMRIKVRIRCGLLHNCNSTHCACCLCADTHLFDRCAILDYHKC